MIIIATDQKLTTKEEKVLNRLDKQTTAIMIKVEINIKGHNNTYLWSPELHGTVRNVSIWKVILTQYFYLPSKSNNTPRQINEYNNRHRL